MDHQNAPLRRLLPLFTSKVALRHPMGFNAASKVPDDSLCIMINANTPPFFCRYTAREKYRTVLLHNNHTIYTSFNRVKRRIQTAYSTAATPVLNKPTL
ncbi:TPA: hypothetical protein ACXIWD_004232 [Serratia marcescens]|uniref:hypothetical protein n=1 Tax=Serratia TaxID=613 RepID=UPI0013C372E3|nr:MULTISPECIES: hypothetical protein [Serratia]MBH2641730.1 hypothetical protein [Serratia ureilytica]